MAYFAAKIRIYFYSPIRFVKKVAISLIKIFP
jgi:hypothetical protein